jgi:DNA polymerase I-like protein with 3'-5' exonuclease and polymerase domains
VLRAKKFKTRLVGQIHDAIVLDVHPDELKKVSKVLQKIMIDDLVSHWDWLNVPLAIEADIGGVDESWNELKPYEL